MWYHASWMRGGSTPASASTSAPSLSALRFRSAAKIALTALLSQRFSACPFRWSRRAETLLSTSLHFSSDVQAFRLAARGCAFRTALRRAAKSLSTHVSFVGSLIGHRFLSPKYLLCSVREAIGRQNPGPCNGLSFAEGPERRHSQRDGSPSPG